MRALKILVSVLVTMAVCAGVFYLQLRNPYTVPEQPVTTIPEVVPITAGPTAFLYTTKDALAEGALYGLAAVRHVMLMSGLGIPIEPVPEEIQLWLTTVGRDRLPVENIEALKVPFIRGSSILTSDRFDIQNALNFRWDTGERRTKVTPETVAHAMNASLYAAHTLLAGQPTESADQFDAVVLARSASEGLKFLEENMKQENGLYAAGWQSEKVTSTSINLSDQQAVLGAYVNLVDYTESASTRYISPITAAQARTAMDATFKNIIAYLSDDETRYTTASQTVLANLLASISLYSGVTKDEAMRTESFAWITKVANALKLVKSTDRVTASYATEAALVRGFALAYHQTKDATLRSAAVASWKALERTWDGTKHIYTNDDDQVTIFSPEDIAVVLGAFRTITLLPPEPIAEVTGSGSEAAAPVVNATLLQERFREMMQYMVKQSGLLPTEDRDAETLVPDDEVPAVEALRKAPVFVSSVAYLPVRDRWIVVDGQVDVSEALHLAAELLLFTADWKTNAMDVHGIPLPQFNQE